MMEIVILLKKVTAIDQGDGALLVMEISNGEKKEVVKKTVSSSDLFHLQLSGAVFSSEEKRISPEQFHRIEKASDVYLALKKGMDFLSYGDNSAKKLLIKLLKKGYDRETSEEAVNRLVGLGYIKENDSAIRFAEMLALKKKYGKIRIQKELIVKGFGKEVIQQTLLEIEDRIDFYEICYERMKKTADRENLTDRSEKRKIVSSFMRYGFSSDEIRYAAEKILEETED